MKIGFWAIFSSVCLGLTSCYGMRGVGIAAAYIQPSTDYSDTTTETTTIQPRDTVYLKDGSIIHGFIIEDQPGTFLKIKTKSGNVFTYQIADVAKITHYRATNDDSDSVGNERDANRADNDQDGQK